MAIQRVQLHGADVAPARGTSSAVIEDLARHKGDLMLHESDVRVKLDQVREAKAALLARLSLIPPHIRDTQQEAQQFNKELADLEHQHTQVMIDIEATQSRLASLQKSNDIVQGSSMVPPPEPLFGRDQVESFGVGAFVLMVPIAIALARRIWLRSGPSRQPVLDLESSPRMQRMEQAIEAIAVEVERIGEAQRFATRLLSERRPEDMMNRVPIATPQRVPGTITPH